MLPLLHLQPFSNRYRQLKTQPINGKAPREEITLALHNDLAGVEPAIVGFAVRRSTN